MPKSITPARTSCSIRHRMLHALRVAISHASSRVLPSSSPFSRYSRCARRFRISRTATRLCISCGSALRNDVRKLFASRLRMTCCSAMGIRPPRARRSSRRQWCAAWRDKMASFALRARSQWFLYLASRHQDHFGAGATPPAARVQSWACHCAVPSDE